MRKKVTAFFALAALVATASASPDDVGTDWEDSVRVGECELDSPPVLTAEHRVKNDVDESPSGEWAKVNYTRSIEIWKLDEERYCAVVEHDGSFDAINGSMSPSGEGELTGQEQGDMHGGYRAMITGSTLKQNSDTTRNIEYSGGSDSWAENYFEPGFEVSYDWWAWVYDAGSCGKWTNSETGNSGNVLCKSEN
jgi:hypothetical protein